MDINLSTQSHQEQTYRNAWVGVGPENVTQQTSVGNVAGAGNVGNLFHLRQFRRKAAMHANDFVVNDSTAREAVERIAKLLPHFYRETAATLVIKAINTVDTSTFVITSQEEKVFWILDFVGKEQTDYFQRLLATVDVVA